MVRSPVGSLGIRVSSYSWAEEMRIPWGLQTQERGGQKLLPAIGPLLTQVSPQSPLRRAAGARPPHTPSLHLH